MFVNYKTIRTSDGRVPTLRYLKVGTEVILKVGKSRFYPPTFKLTTDFLPSTDFSENKLLTFTVKVGKKVGKIACVKTETAESSAQSFIYFALNF